MTQNEQRIDHAHRAWRAGLAAVTTVGVMAGVLVWGSESAALHDPAGTEVAGNRPSSVIATTAPPVVTVPDVPADPAAELTPEPTLDRAKETVADPEIVASPTILADPTDGDLRVDANADVLPLAYVPPAAATTMVDVAYGTDPAQKLDLYLPEEPDAPVVVYLHPGGWVGGDKQFVPDMVLRFVERGYAVVSVGYRLAPEHPFPAPVHDAKRAVLWVKAYGELNGSIDGDRMVIYGASAGGHLAAFIAATPGSYEPEDLDPVLAAFDSTVSGVVSVVGPTDLVQLYNHDNAWARGLTMAFVGCDPCNDEELAAASPINHLHPDLPPAYFAYGPEDELIDVQSQAIAMAEAWAEHAGDNSSFLDLVNGQGHNLDENTVNQRAIEAFIDSAAAGSLGGGGQQA